MHQKRDAPLPGNLRPSRPPTVLVYLNLGFQMIFSPRTLIEIAVDPTTEFLTLENAEEKMQKSSKRIWCSDKTPKHGRFRCMTVRTKTTSGSVQAFMHQK
jgi:hypothetical protein